MSLSNAVPNIMEKDGPGQSSDSIQGLPIVLPRCHLCGELFRGSLSYEDAKSPPSDSVHVCSHIATPIDIALKRLKDAKETLQFAEQKEYKYRKMLNLILAEKLCT